MRACVGLASLFVFLMVSGCSLVPGEHLQLGDGWQSGKAADDQPVVVRDITPKTILQLREARKLAEELPDEILHATPEDYRIGPGDALSITVWDHPELTTPVSQMSLDANARIVRADGNIYYPYLGLVHVAGMTPEELRIQLSTRLVRYITAPQVDVVVSRYGNQRVFFSGAFAHNEPQMITNVPLSLSEALGKASINLDQADLSGLTLRRGGKLYHINLDMLQAKGVDTGSILLKGGDSLDMPYNDHKKVYVMGEVGSAKALTFKTETMTLSDALGQVSGLKQEAAKAKVYVIRQSDQAPESGAEVFRMNANSPVAWVMANRFELYPGDVIFVDTAGLVSFNRVISGLFTPAYMYQLIRTTQ